MSNILLVNITWNPTGWRNTYINPKAGHKYAQKNVGHESLNFKFDKKGIDTNKSVYGFVQWNNAPVSFENGGLIIFYTRNTELNKGQIVGIYGKAEVFRKPLSFKHKDFKHNIYSPNIKGEKTMSTLFPVPLLADNYKSNKSQRMVGQNGFDYRDKDFAERILSDELNEMSKSGMLESEYNKLVSVYEHYIGRKFKAKYVSIDEREQEELIRYYKKTKNKKQLLAELKNLQNSESDEIVVNHKTYKRDNKTIAQIKVLRDFKCQICGHSILKKNGEYYIEAAHIIAKHKKGKETLDNILLLCPNHHKEFDFGLLSIKKHTEKFVEFNLNNKCYKIRFE